MSAIINVWFKKDKVEQMLEKMNESGSSGISIDISADDQTDQYGNNARATIAQSKDEREAKVLKVYVGNGKVRYVSATGVTKAEL
jgi:hypothetical protein